MTVPIRLLIQELGVRPLAHYARYQLLLRSGIVRRRTPTYAWNDRPLAWWLPPGQAFGGSLGQLHFDRSPEALDRLNRIQADSELTAAKEAQEILDGRFRLFGGEPVALGFPPDWLQVPLADASEPAAADRHWTQIRLDPQLDLRMLWELSRFGWAYALGRAYLLNGDHQYPRAFFDLLQSWRQANPPNRGPHWMSAQESALRIMALTFALFAFEDRLAANPDWREMLLTTVAALADRIPPTLTYAQAQRNNHLISEAAGLYAAGLLLSPLRAAAQWKSLGRQLLEGALFDQVFSDGGYIQHSTNYHRLALSVGLWIARLAEVNGEALSGRSLEALVRLTAGLAALVDPVSGGAPNLGSNDGSRVLPLSSCAHSDFRPVLQAASLAVTGQAALPPGPWDEMGLWLGLEIRQDHRRRVRQPGSRRRSAGPEVDTDARIAPGAAGSFDLPEAGLYLVRGEHSWAALRCASYRSRPSQSDQLHLDLWWRGKNIARDPGSYRYNVTGLETAAAHNTLTADDREPMYRMGRFLWVSRNPARYLARWSTEDRTVDSIAVEQRLPGKLLHRRTLVRSGETLWVVLDELIGSGEHAARLSWLLPEAEWELQANELKLQGTAGDFALRIEPAAAQLRLYRGGEQVAGEAVSEPESVVGWWAPSYGLRQPALSLVVRMRGLLPLRLASWWRLGELEPAAELTEQLLEQMLAGTG